MTNDTIYAQPAATLSTGKPMPILGFGTWQINDADAEPSVLHALQNGYRHIDTATGYSNEDGVGRGLRGLRRRPRRGLRDHEDAARPRRPRTADPGGEPHQAGCRPRRPLARALAAEQGGDAFCLGAFVKAQEEGLATSIGVSNYSLDQIDELVSATGVTPSVNQIRWSPANHDPAVAVGLAERKVVLEGYSPFRASNLQDPTLVEIADAHDATTARSSWPGTSPTATS